MKEADSDDRMIQLGNLTASEFKRLVAWMEDTNRAPAITIFTSGACRDAARAFETVMFDWELVKRKNEKTRSQC